ncbi:hypothetical protein PV04_04727 [Phialophora macrospora]|uniref:Uncharacterized protein n=1 Tax=Phialophora macrospora TaxID=1851006 RepID=A0A0D2CUF1_9EURO|nr:hypothetical protein PV04_04727 [Phialophora macrospora]
MVRGCSSPYPPTISVAGTVLHKRATSRTGTLHRVVGGAIALVDLPEDANIAGSTVNVRLPLLLSSVIAARKPRDHRCDSDIPAWQQRLGFSSSSGPRKTVSKETPTSLGLTNVKLYADTSSDANP